MIHPEILFCSRITRVVCENMLHSPVVENHKVFWRLGEAQDIWEKGSNSSNSSPRHKRKAKKDAVFFFQTWQLWYLFDFCLFSQTWVLVHFVTNSFPHVLCMEKKLQKSTLSVTNGASYFIRIRNGPENYIRKDFAPKKHVHPVLEWWTTQWFHLNDRFTGNFESAMFRIPIYPRIKKYNMKEHAIWDICAALVLWPLSTNSTILYPASIG